MSRRFHFGFVARRLPLAAICLGFMAADAGAINRYTSTSMTCAKVQSIISQQGAAIMQYRSPRSGVVLYDRYVRNRLSCQSSETVDRAYIPTSDLPGCPVYRCQEIEFFDFR